jgi:hypothetical protein
MERLIPSFEPFQHTDRFSLYSFLPEAQYRQFQAQEQEFPSYVEDLYFRRAWKILRKAQHFQLFKTDLTLWWESG